MKKLLIILLFLASLSLFGCSKNKGFTKTIYVFDTTVTINLYEGKEANLNDIVDILNRLHKLTDAYHPYEGITNIYSINEAIKNGVTSFNIDYDLACLLKYPEEATSKLDLVDDELVLDRFEYDKRIMLGAGELTNLWKKAISEKALPEEDVINRIVNDINEGKYKYSCDGYIKLTVDEGSKVSFDLGSIVKGYAASKVGQYLINNEIKKFMIDLGQSTILLGEKANGKGFNVAVNGTNYVLKNLKNCSIGTASILEQKVEIDGKIYHHIIDPLTGYPTNTYDTVVVTWNYYTNDKSDLLATYLMIDPEAVEEIIHREARRRCVGGEFCHFYFFKDGKIIKELAGGV